MFAYAPISIANAPIESTMGLVQKIFYFHVPSWFVMFSGAFLCAGASVAYLVKGSREADHYAVAGAELAVVFGLIGLITGPLWARKAWGVWWQWDVKLTLGAGRVADLRRLSAAAAYGGPGSEKLAAGVGIFGVANMPFVYCSVNWWRTIHPKTNVVPTLGPGMRGTFWFCVAGVHAADGADRRGARAARASACARRRAVSGVGGLTMRARGSRWRAVAAVVAARSRAGVRLSPLAAQQQPPKRPAQDEFVPIDELPPQEQLPAAPLLIAAYSVAWVAVAGYLFSIWRRMAASSTSSPRSAAACSSAGRRRLTAALPWAT